MEFRGHDNAVEVVVFAPIAAYGAIRELAGMPVSNCPRHRRIYSYARPKLGQNIESSKRVGAYIASGSRDKLIKLWDTQSGQLLRTLVRSTIVPITSVLLT